MSNCAVDHNFDHLAPLIAALRVRESDVHDIQSRRKFGGVEVDRDFAQHDRRLHVDRCGAAIAGDRRTDLPRRIEHDRCAVGLGRDEHGKPLAFGKCDGAGHQSRRLVKISPLAERLKRMSRLG